MAIPDVDRAYLDPAAIFEDPEAVARHPDLSRDQKLRILRRWEQDARELVEQDEGDLDPDLGPDILTQVDRALAEIAGGQPPEY